MAEEIRLDVVTTAHSRGLKDAERDLRGLRGEADKTGTSFHRTADESFHLDRAIEETRTEIHRLNEEFRRTGDTNLFRHMRRQRSELNQLLRIAKEGAEEVSHVGGGAALDFGRSGVRPRNALIGSLVAALAAAAPGLGAMISGIIAGAIGTVGVAGGIAMATRDPRVRAEARHFGDVMADEFFRGGEAFVKPTIDAMARIEDAFRDMKVPESFAVMAPEVSTIVEGFGELGRNLMPGLNKAFSRMGPFADTAAQGFAEMGTALGGFFDNITKSEGAVMGLDITFRIINGTIALTGAILKVLSDIFAQFAKANAYAFAQTAGFFAALGPQYNTIARASAMMAAAWGDVVHVFDQTPPTVDRATRGIESFGKAAELSTIATRHLGGALSETHSAFLDWAGAEISAEAALDRMQEAIAESNGSLNVHTEKGRAARQSVLDFARAAEVAAQKKFDETQSVKKAEQVYETYRRQLIKTLQAAGLTWREAKRLADQWMGFSKQPNIQKKITVSANVSPEAAAVMAWWNRKIAETHVTIYADTPQRRARGGSVEPGGTYVVGDGGRPEVLEMGNSGGRGYVWPSVGSYMGARGGGAGWGRGGSVRPLIIQSNDPLLRLLYNALVREIGNRGGTLAAIGIR